MKPIIVIQARTGSTRLPNKTMLPFFEGKGILEILVDRIRAAVEDAEVVVATSTNPGDDAIEDLCKKMGVSAYRGYENDVLSRFIGAAGEKGADKLIRICADNIFLDMRSLKSLVEWFDENDSDYASYSTTDGKPMILTHYGLWAIEACKLSALKKVVAETDEKIYHEHVTNYLYGHPEKFKVTFLTEKSGIQNEKRLRLTIDTADDFEMMKHIYSTLADRKLEITPDNLLKVINETPDFYERMECIINQNKK